MIRQWLLLIILFVSFCSEVYAKEDCKFLGQIEDYLWIIDSDGKPVQRLIFVGRMKTATTWSPDGKYIAYSLSTPIGEEKAIIILDSTGQEVTKIIVDPKRTDWEIRYIERLVWRTPNTLWSDSNVGPHGGYIDVWKLDSSLRGFHKKRIGVLGGNCELSPNKQYVACIFEIFEHEKFIPLLKIYNTSKKRFQEDKFFSDDNPRTVELKQMEHVDEIRFTPDNANVIIIGADKKYKFNMFDNKLSEIKELPPDVTIKTFPKVIEIKKDEKIYQAEVFDMYCNQKQ